MKEITSKGYWYKRFISECPICGRGDDYRVRQYTPKPADPSERVVWDYNYDYCNAL